MKKKGFKTFILSSAFIIGGLGILVSCNKNNEQVDVPGPDEETTYTVTLSSPTSVSATVSATEAKEGDLITVTINSVESGYEIDSVSVGEGIVVTKVDDTHYTFTMPRTDVTVTITVKVKEQATYTLSVTNATSGVADIMDVAGNIVELDAQGQAVIENGVQYTLHMYFEASDPNNGRALVYTLNGDDVTQEVSQNSGYLFFTVNGEDVSITVDYAEEVTPVNTYSLTINYDSSAVEIFVMDINSFMEISDLTKIAAGTGLYISAFTMDSSATITGVLNGEPIEYDVESGGFIFEMPAQNSTLDITVSAPVVQSYLLSVTSESSALDFVTIKYFDYTDPEAPVQFGSGKNATVEEGKSVGVTFEMANMYKDTYTITGVSLDGTSLTANDDGVYVFTMPSKPSTISLTIEEIVKEATIKFTYDKDVFTQFVVRNYENGLITYSDDGEGNYTFEVGTHVEVYARLYSGYEVTSVTLDDTPLSFNGETFDFVVTEDMKSLVVATELASVEGYTISVDAGDSGIDPANVSFAVNGDPKETYAEGDYVWVLIDGDIMPVGVKANGVDCSPLGTGVFAFYMPAENVTITFVMEEAATEATFTLDNQTGLNLIQYMYGDGIYYTSGNSSVRDDNTAIVPLGEDEYYLQCTTEPNLQVEFTAFGGVTIDTERTNFEQLISYGYGNIYFTIVSDGGITVTLK